MTFSHLASFNTALNADCVKWCPYRVEAEETSSVSEAESSENSLSSLLACSTYELNTKTNKREGGFELWRFSRKSSLVKKVSTIDLDAGVFRFHWIRSSNSPVGLLAALTDGRLATITVKEADSEFSLGVTGSTLVSTSRILTCVYPFPSNSSNAVCGDSSGSLHLVNLENNTLKSSWKAHSYGSDQLGAEVWTVLPDKNDRNVVYSGADDSLLKVWDLRDTTRPVMTNSSHSAGVTCLLDGERVTSSGSFISSSYDEALKLWDTRQMKRPLSHLSDIGGGVWDLDWEPSRFSVCESGRRLAVACMYGGWRIVMRSSDGTSMCVVNGDRSETSGLLYGISWSHMDAQTVATCCFYDRSVSVYALGDT